MAHSSALELFRINLIGSELMKWGFDLIIVISDILFYSRQTHTFLLIWEFKCWMWDHDFNKNYGTSFALRIYTEKNIFKNYQTIEKCIIICEIT